jgi:hypothetical protein
MGIASKSGSTSDLRARGVRLIAVTGRGRRAGLALGRIVGAAVAVILLAVPAPGRSATLERLGGHVSVGYGQLMLAHAPGGSISFTGGLDLPVRPTARVGIDIGYDLMGTKSVDRGSLNATVSYSAFEAVAFAHWLPRNLGPVGRVSAGPMLMAAHADISAAAGGAGFSDLAVSETAPGFAGEITLSSHSNPPLGHAPPVRLGLQLGGRAGYLRHQTWTVLSARFSVHY